MSENNPIRLFVTHDFHEAESYLRVFEFLESVEGFFYVNVSRPENPPMGGIDAISAELLAQIKLAEVVIVLPELYAAKPDLVKLMLGAADTNDVPMIVIRPFGQMADTPDELIRRAQEHIEWNAREMVDAMRRQARHEETTRWDTIDFPGWNEHGEIDPDKD